MFLVSYVSVLYACSDFLYSLYIRQIQWHNILKFLNRSQTSKAYFEALVLGAFLWKNIE